MEWWIGKCVLVCLTVVARGSATSTNSASSGLTCPVAKFLVPNLGDLVDTGIGYSRSGMPAYSLAGQYDNPMPESTISPSQGLRIWLQLKGLSHEIKFKCFGQNRGLNKNLYLFLNLYDELFGWSISTFYRNNTVVDHWLALPNKILKIIRASLY
jgi:hypothetical protein